MYNVCMVEQNSDQFDGGAGGELIRAYRQRAKFSKSQLAELLESDVDMVIQLEQGNGFPLDASTYRKIGQIPNVTEYELRLLIHAVGEGTDLQDELFPPLSEELQ